MEDGTNMWRKNTVCNTRKKINGRANTMRKEKGKENGKPMTTVILNDHHLPLVSIATVANDGREPFSPGHE